MNQIVILFISLVAGVFLSIVSNWIYDLLKVKGVFPDKPHTKHIIVIALGVLPLLFLVALPQLSNELFSTNKSLPNPTVRITRVIPSPSQTIFDPMSETAVIVSTSYTLPEGYVGSDIHLAYTTSYLPDGTSTWETIDTISAKYGEHSVELSGRVKAPQKEALRGNPFRLVVFLTPAYDPNHTIAHDTTDLIIFDK